MFTELPPNFLLRNRYQIKSRLDNPSAGGRGKGAMGAVYLAEDTSLSCEVAVKQTVFDVNDGELLDAFQREAKLLANLRHPALPRVTNHFTENFGQFLVMDLIVGEDLDDSRTRYGGKLPVDMAVKLMAQLLGVLEYLHNQQPPVIHRDIKPSNLKLTPGGQLVLLDFGIAKGSAGLMTQYDQSIQASTPAYAPPEQMEEQGTDARSDLYSFAATFYHLLSGTIPPHALTKRAFEMALKNVDPLKPLHEICPEVPRRISNILMSALALSKAERPATAAILRRMLADPNEPVTLPKPPPRQTNPGYQPPQYPYQNQAQNQPQYGAQNQPQNPQQYQPQYQQQTPPQYPPQYAGHYPPQYTSQYAAQGQNWGGQPVSVRPLAARPQQGGMGYGAPQFGVLPARQNQTLAIVSLVFGLLSICCYLAPFTGLVAMITGFLGMKKANANPEQYGGKGMAIAGLTTGTVFFLMGLAYWIYIIVIIGLAATGRIK